LSSLVRTLGRLGARDDDADELGVLSIGESTVKVNGYAEADMRTCL
jgi:hypothetical protein